MKSIRKLSDSINKFCEKLTGILLAILSIITIVQVFARRVLGNSLSWTEESARFLFIWIIVLGASIGIKEGFHVSIVIVKEKLKGKAKNILYMGINISILIFSIVLVTSGIKLLNSVNGQLSPAIRLNMLWVYLSIPVSGTFIIIHVISEIIKNIFQLKEV